MLPRRILLALVLVSSLLAAGCFRQVVKTLGELMTVRDELVRNFKDEVNVNVNDGANNLLFSVTYVNSSLNQKSATERWKRAEQTAAIVKAKYARIFMVKEIWVGFMQQTSKLAIFHHRRMVDFYVFDKDAKPLRRTEETLGYGVQVGTSYLSNSDESDVSVSGIQLEGEPGVDGVTMLPHFKVAGDVRAQKSKPPKAVSFDFASYSDQPKFGQIVPIVFLADEKPALETEGTFSGTKAQFCYLAVPYPTFHKMIAAKQLTIKLGDKEYPLTPSQFGALQKMGEYLKE